MLPTLPASIILHKLVVLRSGSLCYLGSDADAGVEGFVVVFRQQLVKQQVELLPQLAAVCPQGAELRGGPGEVSVGVRQIGRAHV